MTPTLCVLCCHGFAAEVRAAIAAEGWADVVAADFPVHCGRPPIGWDELRPLLPAGCSRVVVLGRACLGGLGDAPPGFPRVQLERLEQCFHIVATPSLVDAAVAGGAYLMTPGWVADWPQRLGALGFAADQASEFFRDVAQELVLLDTGVDPGAAAQLAELAATLQLPARRLVVGLDHVRLMLTRHVLAWRLDETRRDAAAAQRLQAAERADREVAMDLLARLASTQTEPEAIGTVRELFQLLFAPAALHYVRVERDTPTPQGEVPPDMLQALKSLQDGHGWTPDGRGFLLRIAHGDEQLGLIAVDQLAFPDARERYLNMALGVVGVCGLAIENARNRRRLVESQMMAALGTVVAGVAHEINTPLGVGLAASSTLHEEAHKLAERFAAQTLTRIDLSSGLETLTASSDLVRRNLERIGRLIEAFRQVAVEHKALDRSTFSLRGCLEDVVVSLGNRLDAAGIVLSIECDPGLLIHGVADDWATIFINLIGNTLAHGLDGREQVHIDVHIARGTKDRLLVDYRDDGCGMTPAVLQRMYEPFFTTDRQHGTGLGMHLTYNLVAHRLRGHIACESAPGHGVHFHLEVPLDTGPTMQRGTPR